MKKRIIWVMCLSVLLCLSMLMSACNSGTEGAGNGKTEYKVPTDEVIDYAAIYAEWSEYLSSAEKETPKVYQNATEVFGEYDGAVSVSGKIARVDVSKEKTVEGTEDEAGYSYTVSSFNFMNLETGKKLFENDFTQSGYDSSTGRFNSSYSERIMLGTIIEISHTVRTNEGDAETPDWTEKTTYAYYKNDGSLIAENVSLGERAVIATSSAIQLFDKSYHCREGEIIVTADRQDIYAIPDFTEEYKGYRYSLGDRIQVADPEYMLTVNYSLPTYLSECKKYILSNGNIYLYAEEPVDSESREFDCEAESGEKYRIHHVVIDIHDGSVSEIDAGFVIVGSFATNFYTDSNGIRVAEDLQYAEIKRIENKRLKTEAELAVIDGSLAEVAVLPAIFKNRASLEMGLGDGKFLFKVERETGYDARYIADLANNSIIRCPESITAFKGAMMSGNKIFGNTGTQLGTLDGNAEVSVKGGNLFVRESYDTDADTYINTYVGYVNGSGEFSKAYVSNTAEYHECGIYIASEDEGGVYNIRGNEIFSPSSRFDGYDIQSADISVVGAYGDSVIIKVKKSYYTAFDHEHPVEATSYYIIK